MTSLITGCGKDEALSVSTSNADYIGNWQLIDEQSKNDYFHLKHVLLTIEGDGDATYLKCDITKDATGGGSFSTREEITLTESRVIKIKTDKIVLEQSASIFNIEYDLEINKNLFLENGTEYLKLEGYTLQKMPISSEWNCPELDSIEI